MEGFQKVVDERFEEFIKKDFDLKLEFEKQNKEIYNERDEILKSFSDDDLKSLMTTAFENFPEIHHMLPTRCENEEYYFDCGFIKFIKAEYLEGYKIKVTAEFFENEYVENNQLERTFSFLTKEENSTQVKYKKGVEPCALFAYFDSDEESLEVFDIFYEFYANITSLMFAEAPVTE